MMHNEKLVGALETDQNLIKFYYKCYKHHESNLIFFPYLKCATSTYKKLFEKLSWNSIDINDIDWNKDHVFSHIKDPLVRHRKGIVEGICEYSPKVKDFFFTDRGAEFLTKIPVVDPHSYTIERWFGRNNATKISWIPLDIGIDHIQETFKHIEGFGITIPEEIKQWFIDLEKENQSNKEELQLFEILMSYETPGEILRYLNYDMNLYALITDRYGFEPKNYQTRIGELKSQGLSQAQAEEIADQEVANGEYLFWPTV